MLTAPTKLGRGRLLGVDTFFNVWGQAMGVLRRKGALQAGEEIARAGDCKLERSPRRHALLGDGTSALPYSLWESSLRPTDIHVDVPPVIQ